MHIRSMVRFSGSLISLHLLCPAQASAQSNAVPPSSATPSASPAPTSEADTERVPQPAASGSAASTSAPASTSAAASGSLAVPIETPTPADTAAVTTVPPTAQFEPVAPTPEVPVASTSSVPPVQPSTSAAFTSATTASTNQQSGALPDERSAQPTEASFAFEQSLDAINAAGQFAPAEFRQREMPGDYVARPVTLPEGTFELTLNNYVAFLDAAEVVGWVPTFAFGVTSSFELGMSAPLRYNESLQDWTKLDPLVHLAQQWLDEPDVEAAARLAVLVPLTSKSDVQLEFGVPFLWHATPGLRVDAAVNAVVALEEQAQAAVNVPLGVTLQATSWMFTGLSATPNVGLTNQRKMGVDAGARLGLTLQARGSAQIDLVATLFAENVGTGRNGQTTDGVGTVFTAAFFPEVY